jgi:hypothetical protein
MIDPSDGRKTIGDGTSPVVTVGGIGVDPVSELQNVAEQHPLSQHFEYETTSTGAVANATPYELLIPMDGWRGCEVQIEVTTAGAGDTFSTLYFSSVEGALAGSAWLDTTTNGWNIVGGATLAVAHAVYSEPGHTPRGHKVKITTAGGNDDMEFDIHVKKWY